MKTIREYDLDFKLATLFRGRGLCKLEIEALDPIYSLEEVWENEISLYTQEILYVPIDIDSW
jgi:hypothetical protein